MIQVDKHVLQLGFQTPKYQPFQGMPIKPKRMVNWHPLGNLLDVSQNGSLFFCNISNQPGCVHVSTPATKNCIFVARNSKKPIVIIYCQCQKKNPYTNLFQPTRPSPLLITKDAVASMKAGSVIVDLVPQSLSQTFFWVTWNPPTPRWCRFAYFFFKGINGCRSCIVQYIYIYIFFLFLAGGKMKEESEKSVKWYDPLNSR